MENRNGLAINGRLAVATSRSEPAEQMVRDIPGTRRITLGGDKAYDVHEFVDTLRNMNVSPHIAGKNATYSMIDGRTTRHPGYDLSQKKRKRVEEIFGWLKTVGGLRKLRHRGLEQVEWMFTFGVAAYNLVRIRNLAPAES